MEFRLEAILCAVLVFTAYAIGCISWASVTNAWLFAVLVVSLVRLISKGRVLKPLDVPTVEVPESEREPPHPACMAVLHSKGGILHANAPSTMSCENENCWIQRHFIHRPTHQPAQDKSGKYPYSERLMGKKRIWEGRFQIRFKKLPQEQLFFGLELGEYVKLSAIARQFQKAMILAIHGLLGDGHFYHSVGDDPQKTSCEVEPPTFVMPLWAFDQVIVSDVGKEPDIRKDLTGLGVRRTEVGVKKYAATWAKIEKEFSTDKVYTLCFWGISRLLDCARWEVCGAPGLPGLRLNFSELCGSPPVYVTMYELMKSKDQACYDRRHLISNRRYLMRTAFWSNLAPPKPEKLAGILDSTAASTDASGDQNSQNEKRARGCMFSGLFECCAPRSHSSVRAPSPSKELLPTAGEARNTVGA